MTSKPLLEIIDLRVEVNGVPIIGGLDLKFEAGKIYAVLGPNASGKSTLAKTVMGLPDYRSLVGILDSKVKQYLAVQLLSVPRKVSLMLFRHLQSSPVSSWMISFVEFVLTISVRQKKTTSWAKHVPARQSSMMISIDLELPILHIEI